jgi:hypothetical protein
MAVDEKKLQEKGEKITGWKDFSESKEERTIWFQGDFIRIHRAGCEDAAYEAEVKAGEFQVPAGYICTVLDGILLFLDE